MKRIITFMVLAALVASPVAGQDWQALSFPVTENITGISFIHPDTGFVVTGGGKVAGTVNGGKSWDVKQVSPGSQLDDVCFLTARFGLICGRNGRLYRTTDGGATWENKSLKDTIPWFFDVEILDDKHCLVIGSANNPETPFEGLIFRTTDGGKSWKKQNGIGMGYNELFYRPGGPVYLLSWGLLNCSTNKGKSWRSVMTVEGKPGRALSLNGSAGIIAGPGGVCAYSSDSGKTWIPNHREAERTFVAAEMISEKVGYIAGAPSTILKTTDGGRSWESETTPKIFTVLDLCFIGKRLYAVGADGGIMFKDTKQ